MTQMTNRELIRLKALQLVYSYYQNEGKSIKSIEKELFISISKSHDLYMYLLALIVALHNESKRRIDILQNTLVQDQTHQLETNQLKAKLEIFANNAFARQLADNTQLMAFLDNESNRWDNDIEFVRRLFMLITESKFYQEYTQTHNDNKSPYDADREFWRKTYKLFIEQNEDLDAILEEKSLYWNDDKEIIDTFVLKTIKRFEQKNGAEQPLLTNNMNEDIRSFASQLLCQTLLHTEECRSYINQASKNWDITRLAYMDTLIMQMAITEMLTFPTIPANVTINVYVDLAKNYSTEKSSKFVNGILDKVAHQLIAERKMLKSLR